jgi:hypothetical protein
MRTLYRLLVAAAISLACQSFVRAQDAPPPDRVLKTNQFDYFYIAPTNPAHRPIYERLKQARLLEQFQDYLAPIRLPQRVNLKIQGCDGWANATFWKDDIIVCYEYFEFVMKFAPRETQHGLSPRDALVGPAVDVLLHEVGHAVLQILEIPFFGGEEDVADYFATYVMLKFNKEDARRLIVGASFISGGEALKMQNKAPELRLLAASHSLPAQRHFNRWCLAYGFDPVLFADAVTRNMLPRSRSVNCRYEYLTNERAFNTLIMPYIDQALMQEVLAKRWFTFESDAAKIMYGSPPTQPDNKQRNPAASDKP